MYYSFFPKPRSFPRTSQWWPWACPSSPRRWSGASWPAALYDLEARTSDLEPRTSNLGPRTSNLEPRTSERWFRRLCDKRREDVCSFTSAPKHSVTKQTNKLRRQSRWRRRNRECTNTQRNTFPRLSARRCCPAALSISDYVTKVARWCTKYVLQI
jgi:hypothetical protein